MKKRIASFFAFVLFAVAVKAQVELKDQPGNNYYELIKSTCMDKMPSQNELLGMRAAIVPAAVFDTIKKYDWVELGGYGYHDKTFTDNFAKGEFDNEATSQYQFHIFRVMADGTKVMFSLNKFQDQPSKVTTTSFDKNTCEVYEKLKNTATASFIQASFFGEKSYLKIVSYKNNVLVLDINKTGKITDNKTMFRKVYRAIPQKFEFSF